MQNEKDIDTQSLVDPLSRKSRRMVNDSLIKFGSSKRVWWKYIFEAWGKWLK